MGSYYSKVEIAAPLETVWQRLSNFHYMSFAPEVITSVTQVGVKGGWEVGAKRILNHVFHETLLSLYESAHCLSDSIDDGPCPGRADPCKVSGSLRQAENRRTVFTGKADEVECTKASI